ncbi:MAG: sigma-54-dependent transcriptional regulator [Myxococcota bacterium]
MQRLFEALTEIAPTDANLLIEGETGVGKELVAEAVHQASTRAAMPLVAFDCAALSPRFAELELLGMKDGEGVGESAIERARGGTLMLDRVDGLPGALQRRAAEVLAAANVRVIALTSLSLESEVASGAFDAQLLRGIAACHVVVPPLRERLHDMPLLVEELLLEERALLHADELPEELWRSFGQQCWRGNVRELRNTLSRWLVMSRATTRR